MFGGGRLRRSAVFRTNHGANLRTGLAYLAQHEVVEHARYPLRLDSPVPLAVTEESPARHLNAISGNVTQGGEKP